MARSVSGLFVDGGQVDSAVGALRDDGFEAARISVVSPDGLAENVAGNQAECHGIGAWLVDHLLRLGHPHDMARRMHDEVAGGRWLVTVAIQTDVEDGSARNLLVRAGAEQISSVTGGTMIQVK